MMATMVDQQRKCQVLDGLKGRNNVRNFKFLANYFYQYFQIFPTFIDKILSSFQNLLTL